MDEIIHLIKINLVILIYICIAYFGTSISIRGKMQALVIYKNLPALPRHHEQMNGLYRGCIVWYVYFLHTKRREEEKHRAAKCSAHSMLAQLKNFGIIIVDVFCVMLPIKYAEYFHELVHNTIDTACRHDISILYEVNNFVKQQIFFFLR